MVCVYFSIFLLFCTTEFANRNMQISNSLIRETVEEKKNDEKISIVHMLYVFTIVCMAVRKLCFMLASACKIFYYEYLMPPRVDSYSLYIVHPQ